MKNTAFQNTTSFLAIIGFVAPQFGVFLLEQTNMNLSMAISMLLRLLSALFFFMLYAYLKRNKDSQHIAFTSERDNNSPIY
ncbi:hypothetical protein ACF5W4_10205 [Bacillota bacterium Lsc_1132]